jgi:hypothetical protein
MLVLTLIIWGSAVLLRRLRYPRDAASDARVAALAPTVLRYFEEQRRCPSVADVESLSRQSSGVGLCPAVEGYPCLSYHVAPSECIFRYPVGFDAHLSYLVVQGKWLEPEQYLDWLRETQKRSQP